MLIILISQTLKFHFLSHTTCDWFSVASSPSSTVAPFLNSISSSVSPVHDDLIPLSLLSSSISRVPDPPSISPVPISESCSIPTSSKSFTCIPPTSIPCSPNSHPIVTRSKHGIHKPKVFRVLTDYTYQEPPTYVVAAKYPQWVDAMDTEFQSLKKQ